SIPRNLFTEGPPHISWSLQPNILFSVASLRHALVAESFTGYTDFPANLIWQPSTPSKIACFLWRVFLRKIATQDNLQKRGFSLPNRCVLCDSNNESIDHIFLSCIFSADIWLMLSSRLFIHGPLPSSIEAFINGWKGLNCDQRLNSDVMKVLLHALLWFIWKERNDRIFKESRSSPSDVFRRVWFAVGDWLLADRSFTPDDTCVWRRRAFDNG
ncbi:Putative ribonuclease H protein At1g65750, partial [Linum perenne]